MPQNEETELTDQELYSALVKDFGEVMQRLNMPTPDAFEVVKNHFRRMARAMIVIADSITCGQVRDSNEKN